jgi:long-chain acyl-CoA synthetase
VLEPEYTRQWAANRKLEYTSLRSLVTNDDLQIEIAAAIGRANERLANPEQVKRYTVLADDWVPGGDELTPTSKLKRRPIAEKYLGEIDAMYSLARQSSAEPGGL